MRLVVEACGDGDRGRRCAAEQEQLGSVDPLRHEVAVRGQTTRRRAVAAALDSYERVWRTIISEGCAEGEFAVDDPKLATLALLGACAAVAAWYRPKGSLSKHKLVTSFAAIALDLVNSSTRPPLPDLEPAAG